MKVFLDDPSGLSYAVGAGGWDDNYLGANVSIEEVAQCARELLLDIVSGGIEETIWRVGGEMETSDVKFARSGRWL